jgi:hypothetical protein
MTGPHAAYGGLGLAIWASAASKRDNTITTMSHRVGLSLLGVLLLCVAAAACSGSQPTPTPTSTASTRAEAAQLASMVKLPASFIPQKSMPGLDDEPCTERCRRSVDTPREALAALVAAMRVTGLVVTGSCVAPTRLSDLPSPYGQRSDVCKATGGSKAWIIGLYADADIRHGRITATGSTVTLAVQPAGERYVLKMCPRGQPCVTYTPSPVT